MTLIGHVSELWRYPVSSTGGERCERLDVGPGGAAGDRLWGVVDTRDGEVAGPEKRRHWRPLPNLFSRLGDGGPEIGGGDGEWFAAGTAEADALVSKFLDFQAALLPHTPFETAKPGHVAPRYQRADLHVLTTASMRMLGRLLGQPQEIDSRRFRPNIVIETAEGQDGFVEHGFVGGKLSIGPVTVVVREPCARCSFTALAQGGLSFEPAVLHRIAQHGEGGFGVLCAVEENGPVSIGDEVRLEPA